MLSWFVYQQKIDLCVLNFLLLALFISIRITHKFTFTLCLCGLIIIHICSIQIRALHTQTYTSINTAALPKGLHYLLFSFTSTSVVEIWDILRQFLSTVSIVCTLWSSTLASGAFKYNIIFFFSRQTHAGLNTEEFSFQLPQRILPGGNLTVVVHLKVQPNDSPWNYPPTVSVVLWGSTKHTVQPFLSNWLANRCH